MERPRTVFLRFLSSSCQRKLARIDDVTRLSLSIMKPRVKIHRSITDLISKKRHVRGDILN